MKHLNLYEENDFAEKAFKKLLVHDSPYFKILNFNFKAGQELPVHNHDIEGQLSLVILEGEGEFLGEGDTTMPAKPGDVVISEIAEPHGLRADMIERNRSMFVARRLLSVAIYTVFHNYVPKFRRAA